MITGGVDAVTPPAYASSYVEQRKAAGGSAELVIVPDAAHFDVVTLDTPAWNIVEPHIPAPRSEADAVRRRRGGAKLPSCRGRELSSGSDRG